MKQFVTYIRVSTKKQEASGNGLEAQQRDIGIFLDKYADVPFEVIGEFCDVDSGKNDNRPEFQKAVEQCRSTGATLLVSKLDRLSRKVSFISSLMEDKKLDFAVASIPNATAFQLHIYAALAEQEREFISERTKAGMASAKARGQVFGGLRPEQQAKHEAMARQTDQYVQTVIGMISKGKAAGATYQSIADDMNKAGVATRQGGKWYPATVRNYYKRASERGLLNG